MARRRFFVQSVRQAHAVLEGDEARRLRRVLRAGIGRQFELTDDRAVYLAEIESFGHGQVRFRILEELAGEPAPLRVALLLSLIKFDRFEWALEKATELGVERIVPVQAERSEKGLDRAAGKRLERWRRVVRESSQQARRVRLPEVLEPIELEAALAWEADYRYVLEEQRGASPILAALPEAGCRHRADRIALLAGPEGGWTDAERARAVQAGWTPVSLGPQVLRAETAALAGLAVIAAAWESAWTPVLE